MEVDYETKLERIIEWASDKSFFNESTFIGIQDFYDEHCIFTISQETAIDNVYYKWKIDELYENKTKKPKYKNRKK
jgi:hypothetical protein